ncbi:MAG: NHL repeat-containing protein [Thaumarchaeota archaeon]|nr:NHL repeat-containing protein [Nitrososphaerota archaeon]
MAVAILVILLFFMLLRPFPVSSFSNGEGATIVIGQTGFSSTGSATTAAGLHSPQAAAFDSSGNLWVVDSYSSRVLEYLKGGGFTTGQSASLVIGQSGLGSGSSATTATGLSFPLALAFDSSGNLWVADGGNDRVLEYLKGGGFTTGQSASLVIGQSDFTSSGAAAGPGGLHYPAGIAFDDPGNLWVVDSYQNRVLAFAGSIQGQTTVVSTSTASTSVTVTTTETSTSAITITSTGAVTITSTGAVTTTSAETLSRTFTLTVPTTFTETSSITSTSLTTSTATLIQTVEGPASPNLYYTATVLAVLFVASGIASAYFYTKRGKA